MNTDQKLCEAIDIISSKNVERAPYDKTIQGTIIECIDIELGKYKVLYQDSSFIAYYDGKEILQIGTSVQVLIPENDMSKTKTIISFVREGDQIKNVPYDKADDYETHGESCFTNRIPIDFCSYQGDEIREYYNEKTSVNKLGLNIDYVQQYIKNSEFFMCTLTNRTWLTDEQQSKGNYGLIFEIEFQDNDNIDETISKEYVFDINHFVGNPYKTITYTKQVGVFKIDGLRFRKITKISAFCNNFLNVDKEIERPDIRLESIELYGANALKEEEKIGYNLIINTPMGNYFSKEEDNNTSKEFIAELRKDNNTINLEYQSVEFYWYKEDLTVITGGEGFQQYGGPGWRCLNETEVYKSESGEDVIKFLPSKSNKIDILKKDIFSQEQKYLCVAVHKDQPVSKVFTVKNFGSNYSIVIESTNGQIFSNGKGSTSLICKVQGKEETSYNYVWSATDENNHFISLSEDKDTNAEYEKIKKEYQELEHDGGSLGPNADRFNNLQKILEDYKLITRVDKNIIHNILAKNIYLFMIYKCAVYDADQHYLGVAEIKLENHQDEQSGYSLVLNNQSQLFQYDADGNLKKDQEAKILSFILYDNKGNIINNNDKNLSVEWSIPSKDSLIVKPKDLEFINDTKNNIYLYKNINNLNFGIENKYNLNFLNNNITLKVQYKNIVLIKQTNLIFFKDGDNGSNGNQIYCEIIPNTKEPFGKDDICLISKDKTAYSLNYTPLSKDTWFRINLWENGTLIYSSSKKGMTQNGQSVDIQWSILKNKYGLGSEDISEIIVKNSENGTFLYEPKEEENIANIIKARIKYKNLYYYAFLPLITIKINNLAFHPHLKKCFQFVQYTSDSTHPSYINNKQSRVRITKDYTHDSVVDKTQDCTYNWKILGQINQHEKHSLVLSQDQTNSNIVYVEPVEIFNGECVTNAIRCDIIYIKEKIASIHIPIHMFINRFGHRELNEWDGNTIQLSEEGGYIFSPQVGAGSNPGDGFTGLLMGKVRESGKNYVDEGLFGFNKGIRTFKLDARNGSTIFGSKQGQIVIDPKYEKSLIYSHNYFKTYGDDGLPKNYNKTNLNNSGLLIDLSDQPSIEFGNGKFKIDAEGNFKAGNFIVDKDGNFSAKQGTLGAGCTFKGTIKTEQDAYIGQNIFLTNKVVEQDDTHSLARIALKTPSSMNATYTPSIQFASEKGPSANLEIKLSDDQFDCPKIIINHNNTSENANDTIQISATGSTGDISINSGNSLKLNAESSLELTGGFNNKTSSGSNIINQITLKDYIYSYSSRGIWSESPHIWFTTDGGSGGGFWVKDKTLDPDHWYKGYTGDLTVNSYLTTVGGLVVGADGYNVIYPKVEKEVEK